MKSKEKRILVVLGTRPEAIKLAPVIKALEQNPRFHLQVCSTGQHGEMLRMVLKTFSIVPDFSLDIMTPGQSLFEISTRALGSLETLLSSQSPHWLITQGDTTTAFTAALAAFYLRSPVAHVEAGLRTKDKYNPFPEEMNRRLISHLGDLHFAPTLSARENLLREGIEGKKIHVTGNTVVDALQIIQQKWDEGNLDGVRRASSLIDSIPGFPERKILLVTCHRRESFGRDLENICRAILRISRAHPDVAVAFPVHLNPRVRRPVHQFLGGKKNIFLWDPLPYEDFLYLLRHSELVLTDSGGIQEEAPSFGKPVLVMRQKTERPEGLDEGVARLVGVDPAGIFDAVRKILRSPRRYARMTASRNPYGDGRAARRIVKVLESRA